MRIALRALTHQDVEAHSVGEDEHTVRWLTGGYGTVESTTVHFDRLADNARAGCGKRGFGVCLDGWVHRTCYVNSVLAAIANASVAPSAPPPTNTARGTLRASSHASRPPTAPMITAPSNAITPHSTPVVVPMRITSFVASWGGTVPPSEATVHRPRGRIQVTK
jgi:hypothetical protein